MCIRDSFVPGCGKQIGRDVERLKIKIKFVKGGFSVKQRLSVIISKITRTEGVVGFKIQTTRKLERAK